MSELSNFQHIFQKGSTDSGRTILALHGTGGDEGSLLPITRVVAPGASILSVRGKVLENGAPRFFRRLAEGVFDMEDLHFRTSELAEFIHQAATTYNFETKDLFAIGYSNGANIASSLMLSFPGLLRGGVLFRAMVPFVPPTSPDLTGTHVFMAQGKHDPLVPLEQAEDLCLMMRSFGASVELKWIEMDHRITRAELNDASDWLAKQA